MAPSVNILRRNASSIPEREIAPESFVDREAIIRRVKSVSGTEGEKRSAIVKLLKDHLAKGFEDIQLSFDKGRIGGLETARLISALHDDIILSVYAFIIRHVVRGENRTQAERISICAVGGFGRGEMAPGSDIDILFLHEGRKPSAYAEQVTEFMLYMLWDMGLKVGQSVRSIQTCLALAKADQTVLTSLLDLRYLCGDLEFAQTLYNKFRGSLSRKGRAYIADKLEERNIRHTREGDSRYVIEPNVKEGKGGLRDLHVLYWIARYLDRDGVIIDAQNAQSYVDMGLFDEQAAQRFVHAADFLWRARIHLHFSAGRAVETLSFDHQIILCRKMGYASGPVEEAVEKFMREYFMNARQVGELTRIACAKLEADKSIVLPKGLDVFLPSSRRKVKDDGFVLDHGRLMFADPMQLREDPKLIIQLFEIAGRRNLDIHPDAFSAINFRRNLIDNGFRSDPEIAEIFLRIFKTSRAPYATMMIMNEAGVLGRYMLEFGGIVARTQFNMHHAYTVDEHTLRLINYFHDILLGEFEDVHPGLTSIVQNFTADQRQVIYLACLLHDTGKGKGDQCIEGAKLARDACRRLKLSHTDTETIAWLVRRHLDMSETAQRRDISSAETIEDFANTVGSLERLQMLTALTIVDMRSVGPGVWNDWKATLIRNLYYATENYLKGNQGMEPEALASATRVQLIEDLPAEQLSRIQPILDEMEASYWTSYDLVELTRHADFFDKFSQSGEEMAVHTRLARRRDITELWILTKDRPGLFADICYAISASGAQIMGAQLHTSKTGRVMNIFFLQNAEHLAFGRLDETLLQKLRTNVSESVKGHNSSYSINLPKRTRREQAIPVKPRVKFIPTESNLMIIETESRDRPGLLYDIACGLRENDLAVLSAHIEVIGTMAIDAFYVQLENSDSALTKTQKARIKSDLMDIFQIEETNKAA